MKVTRNICRSACRAFGSARLRLFLVPALTVALAGCATRDLPPPAPPTALPATFVAAEPPPGNPVDRWWTRFDDERLNALVEETAGENPAVAQAIARLQIAGAQARISRADLFPQLSAGLSAARQRQNLSGLGGLGALPGVPAGGQDRPTAFITSNFGLSAEVSWELDLWGRLSSQNNAARANFLASAANLRAVQQSLAAQAARLYFSVVEARAQLALAERTVGTVGEIARQINNRAEAGIAAPSDRLLANANLESARSGLQQRLEALARLTRQLEILTGDYPAGTLAAADVLPAVPPPPPPGLPAGLLVRRPDIAATTLALYAAGYRLNAAQRALLPNIALTASGGAASTELDNLLSGGSVVWSIAGRLLQPIFQGGRLRAQVDAAEGQLDEALATHAETVLQALAEVETALAVEDLLAQRVTALDAAATQAERAVDISFNRYREGIDPFLAVLEAQQRALESRSAYLAARRARLENRIDLHLALGGGFEQPPPVLAGKE